MIVPKSLSATSSAVCNYFNVYCVSSAEIFFKLGNMYFLTIIIDPYYMYTKNSLKKQSKKLELRRLKIFENFLNFFKNLVRRGDPRYLSHHSLLLVAFNNRHSV